MLNAKINKWKNNEKNREVPDQTSQSHNACQTEHFTHLFLTNANFELLKCHVLLQDFVQIHKTVSYTMGLRCETQAKHKYSILANISFFREEGLRM